MNTNLLHSRTSQALPCRLFSSFWLSFFFLLHFPTSGTVNQVLSLDLTPHSRHCMEVAASPPSPRDKHSLNSKLFTSSPTAAAKNKMVKPYQYFQSPTSRNLTAGKKNHTPQPNNLQSTAEFFICINFSL